MLNRILVVEDETNLRNNLVFIFQKEGLQVSAAEDGYTAKEMILSNEYEIILLDIKLPGLSGLELLELKSRIKYECKFVVMTAYGSIESAVEAIKLGAEEYITKPFRNDYMIRAIKRLLHIRKLESENINFKTEIKKQYELEKSIIGSSAAMQKVFDQVRMITELDTNVMVSGESGTGKELIAKAIHSYSNRFSKPFIPVNCAAIPKDLFESEFFGHVKGSFTGADIDKNGYFLDANGGTLFLDEISEMPMQMQAKLLRVLQENKVRRVGDSKQHSFDTRILSSSNKDLKVMIGEGTFREDLYYRIKVVEIKLPPLREREGDLTLLIDFFVNKYNRLFNRNIKKVSEEAMILLRSHSWPGNIRELEHTIQSAIALCRSDELRKEDFIGLDQQDDGVKVIIPSHRTNLKELLQQTKATVEKEMIRRALGNSRGNQVQAAKELGMSHRNLLYKLKDYGIKSKDDKYD